MRASSTHDQAADDRSTARTGLPGSLEHLKCPLMRSGPSLNIRITTKSGATTANGVPKRALDGTVQTLDLSRTQRVCSAFRVNSRPMKRLVDINISQSCYHLLS